MTETPADRISLLTMSAIRRLVLCLPLLAVLWAAIALAAL